MRSFLAFIPDELFLVLLAAAGLSLTIGQRSWARAIVLLVLTGALVPVVMDPLFDAVPRWVLVIVVAVLPIGVVRQALALALGRDAADRALGRVAGHAMFAIVAAPLRLAAWMARRLIGRR